jgi:lysophospholipase L1-like esterase
MAPKQDHEYRFPWPPCAGRIFKNAPNEYRIFLSHPAAAEAARAWISMIEAASAKNTKIILLTPTPDFALNILNTANILHVHPRQISGLANKYQTGIVDSYEIFHRKAENGNNLPALMSQGNHPNERGHELVAKAIFNSYFN